MVRKRTCTHPRRKARQVNAKARQEAYDRMSLDHKIAIQEPFNGKQYRKLVAKKEKQK